MRLSKSMEKTFRRYLTKPSARHAFVEAEAATALAHQIRALRLQRGWTQGALAKKLRTTQPVVSRLEDASYGRITFKTMVELAKVFDTAVVMKFVSTIDLMRERWVVDPASLQVKPFEEEAKAVQFVAPQALDNVFSHQGVASFIAVLPHSSGPRPAISGTASHACGSTVHATVKVQL